MISGVCLYITLLENGLDFRLFYHSHQSSSAELFLEPWCAKHLCFLWPTTSGSQNYFSGLSVCILLVRGNCLSSRHIAHENIWQYEEKCCSVSFHQTPFSPVSFRALRLPVESVGPRDLNVTTLWRHVICPSLPPQRSGFVAPNGF